MSQLAAEVYEEELFLERNLSQEELDSITERHIAYSKDRLPPLEAIKEKHEKEFEKFKADLLSKFNTDQDQQQSK